MGRRYGYLGGGDVIRMLVLTTLVFALACLPSRAGAQDICPEGTFAIYVEDGTLASCEEFVGASQPCSEDEVSGYLEDGTLAGCFGSGVVTGEVCTPTGEDADADGFDDGCDPCPGISDCDSDGWSDGVEGYVGTDPMDACPDDRDDAAWPPDQDNNGAVNILDIVKFRGHIRTRVGDPAYSRRLDLKVDGAVNILDIVLYRLFIRTYCEDSAPLMEGTQPPAPEPLGTGWHFHLDSQRVHGHAEFRWTVHWFYPIPDWVDVKYQLDMGVTFVWVTGWNVSSPMAAYCFLDDEWPYDFVGGWITGEPVGPGLAAWRVKCEGRVWFLPELAIIVYPASMWIDWRIPGNYGGGASGFHKWWIHEY